MLATFFFLLLLTGGNTSGWEPEELYDAQPMFQSYEELEDGDPSGWEKSYYTPSPDDYPWDDFIYWDSIRESEVDFGESCSYQDVLDHLNLTQNSDKYTVSRPVKSHSNVTWVYIDVTLHAILDVRETDQTFISYSWIYLRWDNQYIWWNPDDFCGIKHVLVPIKHLWEPDLTIQEMTEKDRAPTSPFYRIQHHGWVEYWNNQMLVSTCKMHVYKFPFDTQSCTITFKSAMHSDKEIQLYYNRNNSIITKESRKAMQTQYEWLFLNMIVDRRTVKHQDFNQTIIVYTITMKRRSILYIVNFLLPIFFFLCLDLSSFLISDKGGEKLSFKVTVLLAVTVMQLILNDILPCSSNRIPLIAVYCIGIFALMLLSLLETIVVMHLMEKDNEMSKDNETSKDNEIGRDRNLIGDRGVSCIHRCCRDVSADDTPNPVAKEGSSAQLMEALEKVSGDIEKRMALLSCRKEEEKPGYWTRLTQKINKIFAIFYVTAVVVFLAVIFSVWGMSENE